jgi:hypothetical protein
MHAIGIDGNQTILRGGHNACDDSFNANESCHIAIAWGSEYILGASNLA